MKNYEYFIVAEDSVEVREAIEAVQDSLENGGYIYENLVAKVGKNFYRGINEFKSAEYLPSNIRQFKHLESVKGWLSNQSRGSFVIFRIVGMEAIRECDFIDCLTIGE